MFDFMLPGVVPWGRRLDEYAAFFDLEPLTPTPRGTLPLLDVGAGPSSFAAEAARRGLRVVAVDPLYRQEPHAIRAAFEAARTPLREGLARARDRFVWDRYGSPEALEMRRLEALELFLDDFEQGRTIGRYLAGALPALPFPDGSFRLALVSHLLFLYGALLDEAFHLASLRELLRVAGEVRIFPLLDLEGYPSHHLPGLEAALCAEGVTAERVAVPFEFQKGATEMLRLRR